MFPTNMWNFHLHTLSLEDLSSEILVPVEKLAQKEAEGKLDVYITKQRNKFGCALCRLQEDYAQILKNYEEYPNAPGQLSRISTISDDKAPAWLTKPILMKLVRKANKALWISNIMRSGSDEEYGVYAASKKLGIHILADRTCKIVTDECDGRLHIVSWSGKHRLPENHPNFLGGGLYGFSQTAYDLSTGRTDVLKIVKTAIDYKEDSEDSQYKVIFKGKEQRMADASFYQLDNEIIKLWELSESAYTEALQTKPIVTFKIDEGPDDKKSFFAYLGEYYNGGALVDAINNPEFQEKFYNLKPSEKLGLVLPLFRQLENFQVIDKDWGPLVHGDIKLDNILVRYMEDGTIRLSFCDFGSAKYLKDELPVEKRSSAEPLGTIHSPGFFTATDYECLAKAETQDEWELYQTKRDLFALTTAVWGLLTLSIPYNCIGEYADTAKEIMKFKEFTDEYGSGLASIFAKALSEDPVDRPYVVEVIEEIKDRIRSRGRG